MTNKSKWLFSIFLGFSVKTEPLETNFVQVEGTVNNMEIKKEIVENTNICQFCDQDFANSKALKQHIENEHPTADGKKAQFHGKNVENDKKFGKIKLNFGKKTDFPCDLCSKTFKKAELLKVHKFQAHKNVENVAKNENFVKPKPVKLEKIQATKRKLEESNTKQNAKKARKEFKCDICPKVYKQLASLKNHVKIHHSVTEPKDSKNVKNSEIAKNITKKLQISITKIEPKSDSKIGSKSKGKFFLPLYTQCGNFRNSLKMC